MSLGAVERSLGQLAALLDDHGAADEHFAEAVSLHERLQAPILLGRTQADWAQALIRRGEVEPARPLLEAARRAVGPLGGAGVERRLRSLAEHV